MPKVSVVIPTYNRARFIDEAIQSVLAQTFVDFEIVIVDDGSTDNTKEVVDSFKDHRIRYTYQENQGLPAAGNRGFELSRGEYIAFFSSDDVLVENALEKGVEVLDRHPEVAFSYGQAYLMDERGHVFGLRKVKHKRSSVRRGIEEIREFLVSGYHIPTMTVMVRRNCLFEVGLFDHAFRSGAEDFDLMVRLAKRYDGAYIAEPLAKYRIHSGSISGSFRHDAIWKNHRQIFENVLTDAKLGPILSSLRSRAYFRLHLRVARHAYDDGDIETAREHLFGALKIHPRGLAKGIWLYWFAKTWLPLPVVNVVRGAKRYLSMVSWCAFKK